MADPNSRPRPPHGDRVRSGPAGVGAACRAGGDADSDALDRSARTAERSAAPVYGSTAPEPIIATRSRLSSGSAPASFFSST
jgi:hypothetical protein